MISGSGSRAESYLMQLRKNEFLYNIFQAIDWNSISVKAGQVWKEASPAAESVFQNVLGPAINGYVIWVLQQALKNKVERLYFLARDGYFMYLCAKEICERLGLPVVCKYLCCSRYSIRIPFFHLNMEDALEYVCRGGISVNMKKIFCRAGLTEKQQEQVLKQIHIPYQMEEEIPYAKLEDIRKALKSCDCFMSYVYNISKEALPQLEMYLRQEGLLETGNYALVDSGWVGSMQKTLNQILAHMGRKDKLTGYYWGLYELPSEVEALGYHCYYFSPQKGLRRKVYFSNCLYEAIFSAPHGMTLSYRRKGERYIPVFAYCKETRNTFLKAIEVYISGWASAIGASVSGINEFLQVDSDKILAVIQKNMALFMGDPTEEEALCFGSLEFSDDVLEHSMQQVAAPLTVDELRANHVRNKALVMFGLRTDEIKESAWYEGSVARNPEVIQGNTSKKQHLRSYKIYKYLLYIRQGYFKRKK